MLTPQMILPHRFYILTVKWKKKHLDNDPSLYVNEGATGHHLLPCAFQHEMQSPLMKYSLPKCCI